MICFVLLLAGGLHAQRWSLVYQNDAEGNRMEGSMEALIQAVRDGLPMRVAWSGQSKTNPRIKVEHVADAKFLTIMSDEVVFVQIDPIIGQTPDFEERFIELKENTSWVSIMSTNGKCDNLMRNLITGEIIGHNKVQRAITWFVREQ